MKDCIIAVDLDDTLLNDNEKIPKPNVDTLKKAKRLGATIVISTNRNYSKSVKFAKQIDADFVCTNGGTMINDYNGNMIYSNPMPQKISTEFINLFYNQTQNIFIESFDGLYGIKNEFSKSWLTHNSNKKELLDKSAFMLFIDKNEKWNNQVENFCKKHDLLLSNMRHNNNYCYMTRNSTNKYFALQKIMKKIGKKTLFVFGDDFSDLLSIKNATYGVAMANSRPEILTEAKYKTSSNNEAGVAKFLKKFL